MHEQKMSSQLTLRPGCGSYLSILLAAVAIIFLFISIYRPPNPAQAARATATADTATRTVLAAMPTATPDIPQDYKIEVIPKLDQLMQAVEQLGITHASNVTEEKLKDPEWITLIANGTSAIADAEDRLHRMTPPDAAQLLHSQILEIAWSCVVAAHSLEWYIEVRRVEDLRRMELNFNLCIEPLRQVQTWMQGVPSPTPQILTQTLLLVPTATSQLSQVVANQPANLRAGPGTTYAIVGSAAQGQVLTIVARNTAGDWYQLSDDAWIAAFLVDGAPAGLPVADSP